jgi:lysophospholipase L1-like esterase
MRGLLKSVFKSLITTAIFFLVLEAGLRGVYAIRSRVVRLVPLPYALGDEYGPIPPWLDRMLILVPDDALIWHALPNVRRTYVDIFSPARTEQDRMALLRRFLPTLPPEYRENPTWQISLNSEGYRSAEVNAKAASTIRVACVGDSWTFGMNVDQDRTYPSRLAAWLSTIHPGRRFEVLNFGVLGYSSFQGLQLLERRVLSVDPDIVAIGFGMNDSEVAGYRDKDMVTDARPPFFARARDAVQDLESYKLLDYFALVLKFHPKSTGEYLKEDAEAKGSSDADYASVEPWTRVSPPDYERNLREMIRLSRSRGANVVLLDNELWDESPYRPILKRIAADTNVPLVDSFRIVTDASRSMAQDLESRLDLAEDGRRGQQGLGATNRASATEPAPAMRARVVDEKTAAEGSLRRPPATTVVFRVYRGAFAVRQAMSIAGPGPELGNFVPNSVLMRDDGTEGDERKGDGVWSLTATFTPGTRLAYVYTNSGAPGRWEGLDVPHIRHLVVPMSADGRPVYLPIETFGRIYMQADNWHTDAAGYDLIARAVAGAIASGYP